MYKIKECIIVEGSYDKIKLSGFIDGIILEVHGFGIYNNKDMQKTIKKLAEEFGIVILTDSDSAGFRIRNFIKQNIPKEQVKHAYIPEIHGKERRKRVSSKEGLLGVEGIDEKIIIDALIRAGCEIDGSAIEKDTPKMTKSDLMKMGLTGGNESKKRRLELLKKLSLPAKLSSNMMLDIINRLYSKEEFEELSGTIK